MILIRQRTYSKKEEDDKRKEKEREEDRRELGNLAIAGGGAVIAGSLASRKVRSRLTGKVVRYHNTPVENVESILETGIKASKANDPGTHTRTILTDIDPKKLNNLVYTSKSRYVANSVGARRNMISRLKKGDPSGRIMTPHDYRELIAPKKNKTLKLEFDYDKDIKGSKRIENPELRGAKTWMEYDKRAPGFRSDNQAMEEFRMLGSGTHVFDHDIDPSKIVGGKGYKKRTARDIAEYIKKNPKRFAKGAIPVALGAGLIAGGIALKKHKNKKKKESEEKSDKKD